MRLVGFNFKKVSIEKTSDSLKNLKINTKMNIDDISLAQNNFLNKGQDVVKIDFQYTINYEPKIASIDLKGKILIALSPEQAKELIEGWKKKKMDEKYRITIFNVIYRKSNVKALELEEDMNLPLHMPFPTLKKQKE